MTLKNELTPTLIAGITANASIDLSTSILRMRHLWGTDQEYWTQSKKLAPNVFPPTFADGIDAATAVKYGYVHQHVNGISSLAAAGWNPGKVQQRLCDLGEWKIGGIPLEGAIYDDGTLVSAAACYTPARARDNIIDMLANMLQIRDSPALLAELKVSSVFTITRQYDWQQGQKGRWIKWKEAFVKVILPPSLVCKFLALYKLEGFMEGPFGRRLDPVRK